MPSDATFESFEKELNRLVESFGQRLEELKKPGYAEAQLRDDFLNPCHRQNARAAARPCNYSELCRARRRAGGWR